MNAPKEVKTPLSQVGWIHLGEVLVCEKGHQWVFIGVHRSSDGSLPSYCFHPAITEFGYRGVTYSVVYYETAKRKFPDLDAKLNK